MARRTALVTGASSGIGADLARELAAKSFDLILTARREKELRQLATDLERQHHVSVLVIPLDLARPKAVEDLVERIDAAGLPVDILVNNAGIGVSGQFLQTDRERERDVIRLNIMALTDLTKLLLPQMVQRGWGRVLNVASTAAFQPGPLMAVYYASKAYVLSFSEALFNELQGTGVTVTALCPGPTETEFAKAANMESSRLFALGFTMNSRDVARAGVHGMLRGKAIVIPGIQNKVTAQSVRFAPRALVRKLARAIQEKRR